MGLVIPSTWDHEVMVVDGIPEERRVAVLCGVCHYHDHLVFADGTLKCCNCGMLIAPVESVLRRSILNVNLPLTWQVSWRL